MRKSRFTESQIVEILKEEDTGIPVADILWKHGISRRTCFIWKSKAPSSNGYTPRRQVVAILVGEHGVSVQRACQISFPL